MRGSDRGTEGLREGEGEKVRGRGIERGRVVRERMRRRGSERVVREMERD